MSSLTPNNYIQMHRAIRSIGTAIIALFLVSCEGETTYDKRVRNNSNDTITITVYSALGGVKANNLKILQGEEASIYYDDVMGGNQTKYPCLLQVDSVEYTISRGKTLTKDIRDEDNWYLEYSSKGFQNSVVSQVCYFEFTDEDLH